MKVYDCPDEVPPPEVDYANYDAKRVVADEEDHRRRLEAHMRGIGYNGANTGRIATFRVADGHAAYMMAEGSRSCLVHLPYGDAYEYQDVAFLPKREVLARIAARESFQETFAKA